VKYQVIWLDDAIVALEYEWNMNLDPDRVMDFVDAINDILSHDPHHQGESRHANKRLWFHRPFSVYFEIDEPLKIVHIVRVRWIGD